MSTNDETGTLMTLADAVTWIERRFGVRPKEATLDNWRRFGVRGKKLPYTRIGHRIYVRPEDLEPFIEVHG